MTKATAKPITSITEDPRYVAASKNAERHRAAKKRLEDRQAEINREWSAGGPTGLDMDAILDGKTQPNSDKRKGLREQFQQTERELKALLPELEKVEKIEKKTRRWASGKIARSYEKACEDRAKKFVRHLGELYVLEREQDAMVRHLKAEGAADFLPAWFGPLPDFQRLWIIAQAARMYKVHDIAIPKSLLADPFAVEELRLRYKVTVA